MASHICPGSEWVDGARRKHHKINKRTRGGGWTSWNQDTDTRLITGISELPLYGLSHNLHFPSLVPFRSLASEVNSYWSRSKAMQMKGRRSNFKEVLKYLSTNFASHNLHVHSLSFSSVLFSSRDEQLLVFSCTNIRCSPAHRSRGVRYLSSLTLLLWSSLSEPFSFLSFVVILSCYTATGVRLCNDLWRSLPHFVDSLYSYFRYSNSSPFVYVIASLSLIRRPVICILFLMFTDSRGNTKRSFTVYYSTSFLLPLFSRSILVLHRRIENVEQQPHRNKKRKKTTKESPL